MKRSRTEAVRVDATTRLSLDVLTHIVSMLPTCDVARCARVSKTMGKTTEREQPWQRLQLPAGIPDKMFERFLQRAGTRMESLSLVGNKCMSMNAEGMLQRHLSRCTSSLVTVQLDACTPSLVYMFTSKALKGRSAALHIRFVVRDARTLCDALESKDAIDDVIGAMRTWLSLPAITIGSTCCSQCKASSTPDKERTLTLHWTCPTCRQSFCVWRAVDHGPCVGCGGCTTLNTVCSECYRLLGVCDACRVRYRRSSFSHRSCK